MVGACDIKLMAFELEFGGDFGAFFFAEAALHGQQAGAALEPGAVPGHQSFQWCQGTGGDRIGHRFDRHILEPGVHRLDTLQFKLPASLAQKSDFLAIAVDQDKGAVGAGDGQRHARKASSGAGIENMMSHQPRQDAEAVEQMPCYHFFRPGDGGQVVGAVPAAKQREVVEQAPALSKRQIQPKRNKPGGKLAIHFGKGGVKPRQVVSYQGLVIMKKAFIILVLLLAATWMLAMPALVGAFMRGWLPEWLEETAPTAETNYQVGWFSTRLDVSDQNLVADLRARHFPPLGLAWVDLSGTIHTDFADNGLRVAGQLGLTGRTDVRLNADAMTLASEPDIRTANAGLVFTQLVDGGAHVILDLTSLLMADRLGNHLNPDQLLARLDWTPLDEDHAHLELVLQLTGPGMARLSLIAAPVHREAMAELLDGIEQLRAARPDTVDQQFALLTIAGAWQQLALAGLELDLREFSLAGDTVFRGHWRTGSSWPEIEGTGDINELLDWLVPIIGLSRQVSPEAAEREARAWLVELVDRDWLEPREERFRFRYGPDEHPEGTGFPVLAPES